VVEKFMSKRGFGIIQPSDGGASVFVHWSQINSEDSWPQLLPGTEVEYDDAEDDKGKAIAKNVTLPGGGAVVGVEDPDKANRTLSRTAVPGEVIFFKKEAGYGFLSTEEEISWPVEVPVGSQIYVGREELVNAEGSACNLSKGMKVMFKVYKPEDKDGLAAAEVTGIDGEPLVYEPPPKGKGKGKAKGKGYFSKGYSTKGYSDYKGYNDYKGYSDHKGYSDYKGSGDKGKGGFYGKGSSAYSGVQRTIEKPAFAQQGGKSYAPPRGGGYGKGGGLGSAGAPIGGSAAKGGSPVPPWREEHSSGWSGEGYRGGGSKGYKGKSRGY